MYTTVEAMVKATSARLELMSNHGILDALVTSTLMGRAIPELTVAIATELEKVVPVSGVIQNDFVWHIFNSRED